MCRLEKSSNVQLSVENGEENYCLATKSLNQFGKMPDK